MEGSSPVDVWLKRIAMIAGIALLAFLCYYVHSLATLALNVNRTITKLSADVEQVTGTAARIARQVDRVTERVERMEKKAHQAVPIDEIESLLDSAAARSGEGAQPEAVGQGAGGGGTGTDRTDAPVGQEERGVLRFSIFGREGVGEKASSLGVPSPRGSTRRIRFPRLGLRPREEEPSWPSVTSYSRFGKPPAGSSSPRKRSASSWRACGAGQWKWAHSPVGRFTRAPGKTESAGNRR